MAQDSIYITIKGGDNGLIHHGDVVDYYDPAEWGHDVIQEMMHFSPHHRTVFAVIKFKRNKWKNALKDFVKEKGPKYLNDDGFYEFDITDAAYRKRSNRIDFNKLKLKTGDADIESKILGPLPVDIIDGEDIGMKADDFLDTTTIPQSLIFSVKDRNVVTTGSYTVGTAGDYATFAAADVDTGDLTGDISFTMISNITETASANWTLAGNGYTLTCTSDTAPTDVLTGWILTINHTGSGIRPQFSNATVIAIYNLNVVAAQGRSTTTGLIHVRNAGNSGVIYNCWADGAGLSGNGIYVSNSSSVNVYCCAARDCGNGFRIREAVTVENCFSEGSSAYGFDFDNAALTSRNNVSFNNSTADFYLLTNANGYNNADSDSTGEDADWGGTGSNNNPGLTPATEVELDDTIAGYARPKAGQTIIDSGMVPSIATEYIDGQSISSPYAIGVLGPASGPSGGNPWYHYAQQNAVLA